MTEILFLEWKKSKSKMHHKIKMIEYRNSVLADDGRDRLLKCLLAHCKKYLIHEKCKKSPNVRKQYNIDDQAGR